LHDDKPLLDEVETLDGDPWVVGNETLSLRPLTMLVDPNRLARTVVNGHVKGIISG
jgi:hypothetical protein